MSTLAILARIAYRDSRDLIGIHAAPVLATPSQIALPASCSPACHGNESATTPLRVVHAALVGAGRTPRAPWHPLGIGRATARAVRSSPVPTSGRITRAGALPPFTGATTPRGSLDCDGRWGSSESATVQWAPLPVSRNYVTDGRHVSRPYLPERIPPPLPALLVSHAVGAGVELRGPCNGPISQIHATSSDLVSYPFSHDPRLG
jgi:hypothetical protein